MSAQLEQLTQLLHTTDDVEEARDSLQRLLTDLYKTDGKTLGQKIDALVPSHLGEVLKAMIRTSAIDQKNLEETKRLISDIQTSLSNLRTVSLTLAYDPPRKSISEISDWIKKHFGADTVIEFSIQPQILGGAVIVTHGKYIDKSLKRKLNILFEAKQDEIQDMLKLPRPYGRGIFPSDSSELKSAEAENDSTSHDLTIGEFREGGLKAQQSDRKDQIPRPQTQSQTLKQ